MIISSLATEFVTNERSVGNILDLQGVESQIILAVKFYSGFGLLNTNIALAVGVAIPPVDINTDISVGEWSIIRPLFLLYLERETAIQLEASRGLGVDVFGRSVSEVTNDIKEKEEEIPFLAFSNTIITI